MKKTEPWPFGIYFSVVVFLCLVGLVDAIYLSISHYRNYTDIGYESFCAISQAINCDTVSQSPYSIVGGVPIPVWGVLGYLVVAVLLASAWRCGSQDRKYLWPSLFFLSLLYSLNSIVLAVVSSVYIKSQCIMCILSHTVNFGLLFYAWLIHRRFESGKMFIGLKADLRFYKRHWKRWSIKSAGMAAVVLGLLSFFPPYWNMEGQAFTQQLPTGITQDGYPWIGAQNPTLTITEFADYQCFQCRKMHFFLRQYTAQHADKIRLIHRHFPMDHQFNPLVKEPFHTGSGKLALLAIYAAEKGKFWLINDMIFNLDFSSGAINIKNMAETAGFDLMDFAAAVNNPSLIAKLYHDIGDGLKLGISGTPTFVIDGEIHMGQIPESILRNP